MGDDAGVPQRDARAGAWFGAAWGAVALLLAASAVGESWNKGDQPVAMSAAIVLLIASACAVVVLTVVTARPGATAVPAIAGLLLTVAEAVGIALTLRWRVMNHDLSDIGPGFMMFPAMLHVAGSALGFLYAWSVLPLTRTRVPRP